MPDRTCPWCACPKDRCDSYRHPDGGAAKCCPDCHHPTVEEAADAALSEAADLSNQMRWDDA